MNNGMLGMDPLQANGYAAQMRTQAGEVRGLVDEITRMLTAAGWFGPNAEKFRTEWNGLMREQLTAVIETLEGQAAELDRHAANQIAVSG